MARVKRPRKPKYLIVDNCPVPYEVAAQVYLVCRGAGQRASSVYRGDDAKALLHANGKRTQREIHDDPQLHAISNPPGYSQHELRDGNGNVIAKWKVGVDSGGDSHEQQRAVEESAARLGWTVWHPYKKGVEGHHWQFVKQPKARGVKQRAQLIAIRRRLPRR